MLATKEPLLIVDDDEAFCQVLQRALVRRGFEVVVCHSLLEAHNACARQEFLKAVVDLKIAQESGLRLIRALKTLQPAMAIIMLTGYSSIST
ncbi:MAG TPA: response regulator, partial [Cellvibrionaceae bacterium]|nr:response regulator [Cellvibrionaceae bacterium]